MITCPSPLVPPNCGLRVHNLIRRQQKLGEHYRKQFTLPDHQPAALMTAQPAILSIVDSAGPAVAVVEADPFLIRIYALLEEHLDNPSISVDWLAEQLGMNRKALYRKVQSLIQLTPTDLIRQYRLHKAAELLRAGNNVAETADMVGFSTPSYFSVVFKEFYQQTPSEFIASWSKIA